jgi:leucine efflux protein
LIALPGPATFFVLGKARESSRQATLAALGIVAGDIVLIGLAGLGLAALLMRWPQLLTAIKLAGAGYLAWLGWALLRPGPQTKRREIAGDGKAVLLRGAMITLSNPKPILFFSGFFPLFIPGNSPSVTQDFYLLGAWFEVLNLGYFAALILLLARLRQSTQFNQLLNGRMDALAGWGLLACSGLLLVNTLH